MHALGSLLGMRYRRLRNYLLHLERDTAAKTFVVSTGLASVVGLVLWVSYESFHFIEGFKAFGADLSGKMVSLLFFALMILVVLSTVLITYTTVFVARETSFFFQLPIPPRVVLILKLAEALSFSSWASLFLCLPVLIAFGLLRGASWVYYLEAAATLVLFLIFAGLLGAVAALAVAPLVRRLSPRGLAVGAVGLLGALGWAFLRSFDVFALDGENNLLILDRFVSGLAAVQSPFSPSYWASTAVLAASKGNHGEALFQGALLLANTLVFLPLLGVYGARFYNAEWLRRQSTALPLKPRQRSRPLLQRLLRSSPTAALLVKDVLCFVRDPAQFSQSVLFILLMVIYSLSLLQMPDYLTEGPIGRFIYFANLGAVCMILSSFTSRFLFPLISLEGRAFWILGLAPVDRWCLLRAKLLLGLGISLGLGLAMNTTANAALDTPADLFIASEFVVVLASVCLTALAAGLGAAYPSFEEDNPARIAVGLGGTLNFFASAASIAALVLLEALPYLLGGTGAPSAASRLMAHGAALAYTALLSLLVLALGRRALARSEF